jgi:predicted phosphodiesterase
VSYAVISDVHSNLEALNAVLEALKKRAVTDIFFLGDAVGYGPDPDKCIEILARECAVLLSGNHDWGVCGLTDASFFNVYARAAIEWTRTAISKEHKEILRTLPVIARPQNGTVTLVHASPFEPDKWHYIITPADAAVNFRFFYTAICFIGHSHKPFIMEQMPSGKINRYKNEITLKPDCRYIVNVGSVGQPRDGDSRAGYAVVGDDTVSIKRIGYNIEATQLKMKQFGLPHPLIERLSVGL